MGFQDVSNFLNERDLVYSRYMRVTNMSYEELLEWSKDPCSKKASLDRQPIKRNLNLLEKQKHYWGKKEIRDAKQTISFLARHKGQPSGERENCNLSKRTIALKNWAFDPNK